ncbi:MAG: 1-acyl-sn-glycerol-3-phosphate acyltransferase [Clostridia bacterium]|nr:1-acyl-sn-glycerol-3-phosphate acyltransferase [Clostridia bacterium]
MTAQKRKKWIKFRHKLIRALVYFPVKLYCKIKYHIKIVPFKHSKKQNYFVIYNHQTDGDELFMYLTFKGDMYPLATEDLFFSGFASRLMEYAFAPIRFNKAGDNTASIIKCMRIAKEGASISVAAEGNRTYSGKTEYIKPSIVKLARALKLPIAFLVFEGGYGVQPRWSNTTRKGKMTSSVKKVLYKEDYDNMTDEELYKEITDALYVNEGKDTGIYTGKRKAEFIERLFYTCPNCGLTEWVSNKNTATCKKCNHTINYEENKMITGKDFTFPYQFATEWYDKQNEFISNLNYDDLPTTPLYTDKAKLSEVVKSKRKKLLALDSIVSLYKDKIEIDYKKLSGEKTHLSMPFEKMTNAVVLGRNKLSVNDGNTIYQIKGDFRFNAVKYVNFFTKYLNMKKGEEHGKFLGL